MYDESNQAMPEGLATDLERINDGQFEDILNATNKTQPIVKQIADTLQQKGRAALEALVSMSINLNEAVTASASMIRDTKEVDNGTQTIASAAEELVASVNEINRNTENAAEEAKQVRQAADQGVRSAEKAIDTMENIAQAVDTASQQVQSMAEASEQIGEIVSQIDAIAKQTNLLALNATIEAARAGEAGKGFAVVASEVKNLSNQTTRATEDIRARIQLLQSEMKKIVASMEQGSEAVASGREVIANTSTEMEEVSSQVIGISNRMDDIANILGQQTEASNEIASRIANIAGKTANNVNQIETIVDLLASTDVILSSRMDAFLDQQIPGMTVYRAMSDHIIWKKKLAEMMVGRARLNPDELADHHSCRLGKWYDSVTDPAIKNDPKFIALKDPHKMVHEHGINAARLYQNNDLDGALHEITIVAEHSKEVVRILEEFIAK